MPLSRYQIRNEYSLADPELYRAADKDDPEALLEGVAMAGLVGVLRQLGDLAEFAAEIFHDLHEEVIATAARGHSLMVRVQQLEAELPSIERAFLSQTNHSPFFYNAGMDWHPNMRLNQNLITQGDMPRFIMDSYEECRGPPRLFLLDKFDVAGAGACLKRYTDPSIFKVEASSNVNNADIQREKRIRKGKKKGSRWRNGETPEVLPTSHAKLHQLLLEERIENTISDPARHVKLKRRLNGFPFDSKTGESYMGKFLKIASPEHKVVHEVFLSSSLKLPTYSSDESGIHDISLEGPDEKIGHESLSPTPNVEGTVQKLSMDKLVGVASDNGLYESPKAQTGLRADKTPSAFHDKVCQTDIAGGGETKTEANTDDYHSDDFASEVDNYVDALATMEPEIDTDSESRPKNDLYVTSVIRGTSGLDATHANLQAPSSDSQSMGSSMLSEDGNSSSKKGISSSTCSDTRSLSAENTPFEGEVSTGGLLFNELHEDKGIAKLVEQQGINGDVVLVPLTENLVADGGNEVAEITRCRHEHSQQCLSNPGLPLSTLAQLDSDCTLRECKTVTEGGEEMPHVHNSPETETVVTVHNENFLNTSDSSTSDAHFQTEDDSSPRVSAGEKLIDNLDHKYGGTDPTLPCDQSDMPCYAGDLSGADSPKSHHQEAMETEGSLYSACQTQQEVGDSNSNMREQPPECSPLDSPVDKLVREDLNISDSGNDDLDVLSSSSVHLPNTINITSEDKKSPKHPGSIPEAQNSEDKHMEDHDGNLREPHLEGHPSQSTLPAFETCNSVSESDHIFSAPVVDILASAGQSLEWSLPKLDIRDSGVESNHIISEQGDVMPLSAVVAFDLSPESVTYKDVHSTDLPKTGDIGQDDPSVILAGDQVHRTVNDVSSLDGEPESSVTESPEEVHSNHFQISEVTDDVHLLDQAACSTVNHIDSESNVVADLGEKSLDVILSESETHSKDAEPDVLVADNLIRPVAETEEDIKPSIESPNTCNLQKTQASVILEDVSALDLVGTGNSYNGEQVLQENPSSEEEVLQEHHGLEDGLTWIGVTSSSNLVETDASNSMVSSDRNSLIPDPNLTDGVAKEEADTSLAGYDENDMYCGTGMCLNLEKLDDKPLPQFGDSNRNQIGASKFHTDNIVSEFFGNDSYSLVESSLNHGTGTVTSLPLQNHNLDTTAIPFPKSNLPDYPENISLLHMLHAPEEQNVKLSRGELDKEGTEVLPDAAGTNTESLEHLEHESILDHSDQARCSYTTVSSLGNLSNELSVSEPSPGTYRSTSEVRQPKDPVSGTEVLPDAAGTNTESLEQLEPESILDHSDQARCSYTTVSSLRNLSSELSVSEPSPGTYRSANEVQQPKDPVSSAATFELLHGTKINMEEMPPLPPLPPVQWRMGKQQHTSVLEKGALQSNQFAFPSLADQRATGLNPFLPPYGIAASRSSHLVYENTSTLPVSYGPPLVLHHGNIINNLPPVGDAPVNHFLPLAEKLNEICHHDGDIGKVQPSLGTSSKGTSADIAATYASKLPHDEKSDLHHLSAPETSIKDEKQSSENSDAHASPHDGGALSQGTSLDTVSSHFSKQPREEEEQSSENSDAHVSPHDGGALSRETSLDTVSSHSFKQLREEEADLEYRVLPETSLTDEKLIETCLKGHGATQSDGNLSPCDGHVVQPNLHKEQSEMLMPNPLAESSKPAQDDGVANGGRTTKLPRPRNPLIDAVVAHDKSKLRKVAERPRPQLEKTGERDSLLEQIRAKSFNLKPTVVSRPSIQGPTTNLKVAAILEKAKTIRQAFAGSDEDDDDDDSWSDS